MKKYFILAIVVLTSVYVTSLWSITSNATESKPPVSGKIINGFRILPIHLTDQQVHLTVYRGDYIKFAFDDSIANPFLVVPSLSIAKALPRDLEKAPFFKMKKVGAYPFSLGEVTGNITVIAFNRQHYREITAIEAAALIENTNPLILDVRTSREFRRGHLANAVLIPVQELQARVKELDAFKSQGILVYCATGNRSTVASKILLDNDFNQLYNLRHGIVEWSKNHSIVR